MCTAINSVGDYHLFGRTLDLECSYDERVVAAPRNFRIDFLHQKSFVSHLAMIGIACVIEGVPLYYDAMNEAGLCMAALNFPDKAVYCTEIKEDMNNLASFELIPWILCQCESVNAARELLSKTNVTDESFSQEMPATKLHWIVADRSGAITVESTKAGLVIYENSFGVLTNSPEFSYHTTYITDFLGVDSAYPKNLLCPRKNIEIYSRGLGAKGLPGDFSSASRFVRAVFLNEHTDHSDNEVGEVNRIFHIMSNLSVPCGSVKTSDGTSVMTVYTSCACSNSMTYYFTTYDDSRIRDLSLNDIDMDGGEMVCMGM